MTANAVATLTAARMYFVFIVDSKVDRTHRAAFTIDTSAPRCFFRLDSIFLRAIQRPGWAKSVR
jgi:hypothetical protein